MSSEKSKEMIGLIVVGLMVFLWIGAWIELKTIHLARGLFWVDAIFIPLGFIGFILFLVLGILEGESYFVESNRTLYFVISSVCLVFFLLSMLTINSFYEKGYSDDALKREAELLGQMQAYEMVIGLYTGGTAVTLENQVISNTIDGLCQTPTPGFDCNQMRGYYQVYVDIKGAKDTADEIVTIWK